MRFALFPRTNLFSAAILAAGTIFQAGTICQAAPAPDTEPPFFVSDEAVAGERVFDLPNDASAWHLSIFTSETPSAREQAILAWFRTDPQLSKLWRQCHPHHYSPKSSLWSRYAYSLPALPCVRLQKPDGTVVSQYSGLSSHLDSADNLKRAIRADMLGPQQAVAGRILNRRPHCPVCPNPDPGPSPYNPDEEPDDVKPAVPDTPGEPQPLTPEQEAEVVAEDRHEVVIAVGVFLLVLAFAYIKDRQAQTY